jgi:hypothetical protein
MEATWKAPSAAPSDESEMTNGRIEDLIVALEHAFSDVLRAHLSEREWDMQSDNLGEEHGEFIYGGFISCMAELRGGKLIDFEQREQ